MARVSATIDVKGPAETILVTIDCFRAPEWRRPAVGKSEMLKDRNLVMHEFTRRAAIRFERVENENYKERGDTYLIIESTLSVSGDASRIVMPHRKERFASYGRAVEQVRHA